LQKDKHYGSSAIAAGLLDMGYTKPRPKSVYDFLGFVYCLLFNFVLVLSVPRPYTIYFILICWKWR